MKRHERGERVAARQRYATKRGIRRRGLSVLGLLIGLGLTCSSPALAEEDESVRLSLADCLRAALENNLDLVSARKDPEISEQNIAAQQGTFDPTLFASSNHSETEQEISNLFSLNQSTNDTFNGGVSQNLHFGGDYRATLSSGRFQQSGPLVTAPTSYNSSLDVTLNLPLLRGAGKTVATEQLELARGNLRIGREDLRRQAETTMEAVEAAYWEVVAARRGLGVAHRKLGRAHDLLELNRRKVEVGTLAPIEITQAEAGVATSEEQVIVAETALENAEDELLRLLAIPEGDPMWERPIVPIDEPTFAPVELEPDAVYRTALENRPELASARQGLRNSELSERVARNAVRPSLDLALNARPSGNNFEPGQIAGPGPDGLIGTPDDVLALGGLGDSLSEIPELDNLSWSAGLNFSYPLRNRAAKASYAIAKLNRQKSETAVANQEQAIRVEVRRAVREVESSKKRIDAARASVVLQRKQLEAEQKKFENGMSTSFDVLTFQNQLADGELSEIRALIDYNKALAALERVQGTLLVARGLSLAP